MLYCDRAVGSFFMVRRLSKIVSHHGWLKTYNFRMKLAKTFRMFQILTFRITVPPKKNNSKPHFRVDFLISDFLVESLKPKKDQKKKITHFTIQFRSKSHSFYKPCLAQICSRNQAKNLTHFTNFQANMFLVGVIKSICTTPFQEAQELHSRRTWKVNVCILLCISERKFLPVSAS